MKQMTLAASLLALLAGAPAASAQTQIWVNPAEIVDETLTPGSMLAVTVHCAGLDEVRGIRVLVTFNPNVLQFLWHDPGTFTVLEISGTDDGLFDYSTVRGNDPATGAFSVVTLHFMVKTTGHCDLALEGSPFEQVEGPCYIDKDFAEFAFDQVTDGYFSNDGIAPPPPPTPSPTASPSPSPGPEASTDPLPGDDGSKSKACSSAGQSALPLGLLALIVLGASKLRA